MKVVAHFKCSFIGEETELYAKGRQVTFYADQDDPVFKVATPSGHLSMIVVSEASQAFEVGKTYKLTFEPLEALPDQPEVAMAIDPPEVSSEPLGRTWGTLSGSSEFS